MGGSLFPYCRIRSEKKVLKRSALIHIFDVLQYDGILTKYPNGITFPNNIPHVPVETSFVSSLSYNNNTKKNRDQEKRIDY